MHDIAFPPFGVLTRRAFLSRSIGTVLGMSLVGTGPAHAGAMGSDLVFLTDRRSRRLVAFSINVRALMAETVLPQAASHLITNPVNGLLAASEPASDSIWLLGGADLRMVHEIALDVSPWLVAFSPDGRHLAAADMSSGRIQILDPATSRTRFIESGFEGAHDLRFSADGEQLYVSSLDDGIVRRMDVRTGETMAALVLPGAMAGIDHMTRSADGRHGLIVTPMRDGQEMAIADLSQRRLIRQWRTNRHYRRAYADPFSRWFLLASDRNVGLDVLDRSSGGTVAHVDFDMPVDLFAAGFVGTGFVVGDRQSGRLALVDGNDLTVAATLDLGAAIHSVFMDDGSGEAVAIMRDGAAVIIDMVPRRGVLYFEAAEMVGLGVEPDLSAHPNALNFCHA